jgi:Flp pilus assembly pilin Flp
MIVALLGFVLLAGVVQLRAEVCEAFNSNARSFQGIDASANQRN